MCSYIGWLLGVETTFDSRGEGKPTMQELPPLDPCGPGVGAGSNPIIHSRSIFQSIVFHLLHPDESSVKVSHHLLKITDRKPPSMRLDKIPEEFYKNTMFYFRCFNCRRMIGDPLADALLLPVHPKFWMRTNIYLMSTFFFVSARVYSNAARWILPARRWIIRWHTKALRTFHETWMRTHKSKMAYALARNEKASILDLEYTIKGDNDTTSLCPFAMTAKPT
jgi:hypothetical protein